MNIKVTSSAISVLTGLLFFCSCTKTSSETTRRTFGLECLKSFQERQFEFGNLRMLEGYPDGFVTKMAVSPNHRRLFLFQIQYRQGEGDTGYFPDKPNHGLWTSKDDGKSWTPVSFEGESIQDIIVDDINEHIYISTNNGNIKFSEDLGKTWELFSYGLSRNEPAAGTRRILRLSLDPVSGKLFGQVNYNGAGVYEINKQGTEWRSVTGDLPEDFSAFDVCYSPEEKVLYVINGNTGFIPITPRKSKLSGLYRGIRQTDGYQWTKEPGLPDHEVIDPAVLRITIEPRTGIPYATSIAGVYRKTHGRWQSELDEDFIQYIAFEATDNDKKREAPPKAVALSMNRLYFRNGNEWSQIENTPWHPDATLGSMLYYNGVMFISMNDGFWVTRDEGENWIRKTISY